MTNVPTYDLSRMLYRLKLRLLAKIVSRVGRLIYACEIPYTAEIARDVRFAHRGLGVVIGHDTKIGPGCDIGHNVTIGGRSGLRANPILGRQVLVGAGACILGQVHVGDNASVGAQAVVLSDVPPGFLAVGVPAKISRPKRSR